MPSEAERTAKILALGRDMRGAEQRGVELRSKMRECLDELDRLSTARSELERRIQGLIDDDGGESADDDRATG